MFNCYGVSWNVLVQLISIPNNAPQKSNTKIKSGKNGKNSQSVNMFPMPSRNSSSRYLIFAYWTKTKFLFNATSLFSSSWLLSIFSSAKENSHLEKSWHLEMYKVNLNKTDLQSFINSNQYDSSRDDGIEFLPYEEVTHFHICDIAQRFSIQ